MLPAIPVCFAGAALLRWWRGHGTLTNLMAEVGEFVTGVPLTLVTSALAEEKILRLVFPKDGEWVGAATPRENVAIVEIAEKDFGNLLAVLMKSNSNDAALASDSCQRGVETLARLLSHATDAAYFTPRGGVKYAKFLLQRFGDGVGEGICLQTMQRIASFAAKEGISNTTLREWLKEVPAPLFLTSEEGGAVNSLLGGDEFDAEWAAINSLAADLGMTKEEAEALCRA